MKILALPHQPQFWLGIGVVTLVWFGYRVYLRFGRRCRKCGRIWGVKRVHKIRLARDESISLISPHGKWRWWIRRVDSETFSVCKCKWKESVKVTRHPISVWHAWWVKIMDRQQYYGDPDLDMVSAQAAFKRRLSVDRSLDEHAKYDTPTIFIPWDEL